MLDPFEPQAVLKNTVAIGALVCQSRRHYVMYFPVGATKNDFLRASSQAAGDQTSLARPRAEQLSAACGRGHSGWLPGTLPQRSMFFIKFQTLDGSLYNL